MNRDDVRGRIKGMGRSGIWALLSTAVLATACSSSPAPVPTATIPPSPPAIAETPTAPAVDALAPRSDPEPTPVPAAVEASLPATATAPPAAPGQTSASAAARVPVQAAPVTPPPTAVPEPPSRPPPVTVSMTLNLADRSFTPHQVHGNAGDTVALTFAGGTEQHTFTVSSIGIDVTIAARETKQFSFVMPVDGEVPFFCRLHGTPSSGMHGLLIFH